MSLTITLSADERKALLHLYRHPSRPELAHRAHILLLLDQGYPWDMIAAVLFTSASTIARWQQRFPGGESGNNDDSHRVCDWRRPNHTWVGDKSEPPRR